MASETQPGRGTTAAPVGKIRSPWAVIGLTIITLGIYHLYWLYVLYQEQVDHNGEGTSGIVGLIIGIIPLVNLINLFLLPHTVGQTYERAGQEPACTAATGFWNLIPVVGAFVWLYRVQDSMNRYWETRI